MIQVVVVKDGFENVQRGDVLQPDGDGREFRFALRANFHHLGIEDHVNRGLAGQGFDDVHQRGVFELNERQDLPGWFSRRYCLGWSCGGLGAGPGLVIQFLDFFVRCGVLLGQADRKAGVQPNEQQGEEFGFHVVVGSLTDIYHCYYGVIHRNSAPNCGLRLHKGLTTL